MPRYRVLPYRQGSRSARALSRALPRGLVLKTDGTSRFRARHDDVIINWGNTEGPSFPLPRAVGVVACCYLNPHEDVIWCSNKRNFFELISEAGLQDITPLFWTDQREIPNEAFPVVCRTVLAGHSGAGIVLANDRDDLVNAPLYVQYVKKQEEFRVHVGRTRNDELEILAIQRKARRREVDDDRVNWQIRNHANGFIYQRNGFECPRTVRTVAGQALEASGLDFGAVDVIWNQQRERAYVLEINTAPGLEGQTIEDYAEFFRSWG